ncbi:MAG: hypothetical protein WCA91_09525 [Candidatus Acidiferrales bacterium]
MCNQFSQVLGKGVVVVVRGRLAGFAEPSAVICDDTVACAQQDQHLLFPRSAAQWISVNQHNRLTGAVVLVVEVDVVELSLPTVTYDMAPVLSK